MGPRDMSRLAMYLFWNSNIFHERFASSSNEIYLGKLYLWGNNGFEFLKCFFVDGLALFDFLRFEGASFLHLPFFYVIADIVFKTTHGVFGLGQVRYASWE